MSSDGRVVILIVEDEAMVRLFASVTAHEAGFEALEAGDSNEAARLLDRHPEIRIVFADIRLPGSIDGMSFADYVSRRWPEMRIILTSGMMPASDVILPPGSVFLPKPYRPADLVRHLKAMAAR